MTVDKYFNRRYNQRSYNCAHLVCEVFADMKGPEMGNALKHFLCGPTERKAKLSDLRKIKVLDAPESPCVVFMQGFGLEPHVGIYVRGRVLHIRKTGVQYQPLRTVTLGYKKVRFLTC